VFIETQCSSSSSSRWILLLQMGDYNVPYGKKNRGMTVVHSYRYVAGKTCTDEGVRLAMILGWCVEWVSAN